MTLPKTPRPPAVEQLPCPQKDGGRGRSSESGFTIAELLVSITIVAILISLVLPLLARTIAASRGFKCQQSLRSVAYDFQLFADDDLHGYRGEVENQRDNTFTIENFAESQYGVHEFWAWPGENRHSIPDGAGYDPMRCAEVKGEIVLRSNMPCATAVIPPHNISYAFNIRLRIAEIRVPTPRQTMVYLTSGVPIPDAVPLLWDIDAPNAVARNQSPFYSGPSLDSPAVFAGNRYWFPGMRHNGAANFAFVDGHVESSMAPLEENTWDWGYSPRR